MKHRKPRPFVASRFCEITRPPRTSFRSHLASFGQQGGQRFASVQQLRLRAPFLYTVTVLLSADYKPEFESLRDRLLELAQIRHVDELLKRVVTVLAERPHVALARIWLVDRGDLCASCHMAARCPDRTSCLHLVASAGAPRANNNPDWSRVDGEFSRMPLGVGKVGRVGANGRGHRREGSRR